MGFYIVYQQWLSWLFLMAVVFLPVFSLVISLPAMLMVKVRLRCPYRASPGETICPKMEIKCPLPTPEILWKVSVRDSFTGGQKKYAQGVPILPEHCGCLWVQARKQWVCDYLGVLRRPLPASLERRLFVWPKEIPVTDFPGLHRYLVCGWQPKYGGGFSEDHDLRLYRPGDDLRQIHWKLAAKTGKLVLREPILPVRGKMVLTLLLRGSPEILDEKLGKLLYLSGFLLKKGLHHEIHCLTGDGMRVYAVADGQTLTEAMEEILSSPVAKVSRMPSVKASWQYRIGGDRDEA